jgi:hypothetical protein
MLVVVVHGLRACIEKNQHLGRICIVDGTGYGLDWIMYVEVREIWNHSSPCLQFHSYSFSDVHRKRSST